MINAIKCFFGMHKYERKLMAVLDDGHKITYLKCAHCGDLFGWR